MPLIVWDKRFSVGIAAIDQEHKELVGLLNGFHEAVEAGEGKETLGNLLAALIDYTKFHFANEEKLFSKSSYPEVAQHKKKHEHLVEQVHELQARYATEPSEALSLAAVSFLKDWLLQHIQGTDKKYAPYVIREGIQ